MSYKQESGLGNDHSRKRSEERKKTVPGRSAQSVIPPISTSQITDNRGQTSRMTTAARPPMAPGSGNHGSMTTRETTGTSSKIGSSSAIKSGQSSLAKSNRKQFTSHYSLCSANERNARNTRNTHCTRIKQRKRYRRNT